MPWGEQGARGARERSVKARGGAGRGVRRERWNGMSNDTRRVAVREEQQRGRSSNTRAMTEVQVRKCRGL